MLHPNYAVMDPRFSDVQIASNFAVAQATAHSAVNRAKNPDFFPKYLHNFTRQIMSFDKACDLVKTAHKIAGGQLGCGSQGESGSGSVSK